MSSVIRHIRAQHTQIMQNQVDLKLYTGTKMPTEIQCFRFMPRLNRHIFKKNGCYIKEYTYLVTGIHVSMSIVYNVISRRSISGNDCLIGIYPYSILILDHENVGIDSILLCLYDN